MIGDQWPFQGWGVQAGQYRAAPPACLMARSAAAGAFADADQGEADPGLPDDRDQPGAVPAGVPVEPVEEVLGPADVVPGVPVGLVEVEHVDDAELLPGHGWVLQSTTQATGHAVPHWCAGEGDLGDAVAGLDLGFGDVVGPAVGADVGVEQDPELVHRGSPLPGV